MTSREQGRGGSPLTADEVLAELEVLAGVEHALIVEYLSVQCALGHDLSDEDGGPTTTAGSDAASAASSLAQGQMFRLSRLSRALVDAGRTAQFDRTSSIAPAGGGAAAVPLSLDPPTAAELAGLVDREEELAKAVDASYARLAPSVTTAPVFEGDALDTLRAMVEDGQTHADALGSFLDALRGADVAALLRATRREAADDTEQRLLNVSDRLYQLLVFLLREWLAPSDDFFAGGRFRQMAISAMFGLDDADRLLVQRKLLPAFTIG